MNFQDLITNTRSTRRFNQNRKIEIDTLKKLVNFARLSSSSSNLQTLKYFLSTDCMQNEKIFLSLKWAYYLKDWEEPKEGEKPAGYIIIMSDTEIHPVIEVDVGIAIQSIRLGATSLGLSSCPIGSIDRPILQRLLRIPEKYEISAVIALGEPAEKIVIEDLENSDNTEYWRDENDIHHVPKRKFDDIIILEF